MRTLLILAATVAPIAAFAGDGQKPAASDARKEANQRVIVNKLKTPEAGLSTRGFSAAKPATMPEVDLKGAKLQERAR